MLTKNYFMAHPANLTYYLYKKVFKTVQNNDIGIIKYIPGLESQQEREIFSSPKPPRPDLRPIQPPT
jgi:hypothetical protein